MKQRINISMSDFIHRAGKDLAKRRGMDFSELLSGLLRAELAAAGVAWEKNPIVARAVPDEARHSAAIPIPPRGDIHLPAAAVAVKQRKRA
jgi:hypothetical protein